MTHIFMNEKITVSLCHSFQAAFHSQTQTTSNYLNVCNSLDRIAIYEQAVEKSVVIDDSGAMCVCAHYTMHTVTE